MTKQQSKNQGGRHPQRLLESLEMRAVDAGTMKQNLSSQDLNVPADMQRWRGIHQTGLRCMNMGISSQMQYVNYSFTSVYSKFQTILLLILFCGNENFTKLY